MVTICSGCALDHHRDHYLEKFYSNFERKDLLWKLREYLKINNPRNLSATSNDYKQRFTHCSKTSDSFSYMKPKSSSRLRYRKMISQGYVNLFENARKTPTLEYTEIIWRVCKIKQARNIIDYRNVMKFFHAKLLPRQRCYSQQ